VSRRRTVWFIVPESIDDPERVSGGNVYDRQLRQGLVARGWTLRVMPVADKTAASDAIGRIEAHGIALVDGLVAGWAPDAIEAAADHIPVIIVAHMISAAFPGALADIVSSESRALRAASAVIATSEWTAGELVRMGLAVADRVAVAPPGAREASVLRGADHRALLCVGAIAPHKGQDVLLAALELLADRHWWSCTLVGSQTVDPDFTAQIRVVASRFGGRIQMPGVLHGAALDRAYRRAGLLVAPSRTESFGMAVVDARSLGLPILATAVGGIPEASAGGGVLLVPPDDSRALADALDEWFADPTLRSRLREQAERGSSTAPRWADTIDRVDQVLVAA
jgi:glycosyltransferase involved in cell wall biosynthesis